MPRNRTPTIPGPSGRFNLPREDRLFQMMPARATALTKSLEGPPAKPLKNLVLGGGGSKEEAQAGDRVLRRLGDLSELSRERAAASMGGMPAAKARAINGAWLLADDDLDRAAADYHQYPRSDRDSGSRRLSKRVVVEGGWKLPTSRQGPARKRGRGRRDLREHRYA